jgi:hypothetical protein
VVTVDSKDAAAQTVTVKGPRGNHYVAHVADTANFDKINVGDTVVMTFTKAVAVVLKPAA